MTHPRAEELLLLEKRLLTSTVPEEVAGLLAAGFRELGSSGRVYGRDETIASLPAANPRSARLRDEAVVGLAEGVVLLTDRSEIAGRVANRSSIWRRNGSAWELLFHQKTAVPVL